MLTIDKFLKNITLDENTKNHLKEIWLEIEHYLKRLQNYSVKAQNVFLEDYLMKENINSSRLEGELYSREVIELYYTDIFDNLKLSHNKLKLINKSVRANDRILDFETFEKIRKEKNKNITYEEYVTNEKNNLSGNYRKEVVWIGGKGGIEYAHHVPPKPDDIESYIDDFINYYNRKESNELSDPIVKAALIHMFFIKIHPFSNGNGRTARILLNGFLRGGINKKYNLNFKFPPLNLSTSFELSRITYFKRQNDIIFKENIDNNFAINSWVNYNLIAIEEQLYYLNGRLDKYDRFLTNITNEENKIEKK